MLSFGLGSLRCWNRRRQPSASATASFSAYSPPSYVFRDAWQGVRGVRMVARGGLHGATLRPADVLRGALELGALTFVMTHNHPSGDPTPSDEDVELTRGIEHRAHLIGVELVDHVVVCPNGKFSSVFKS
ncbi:JAB domain-containing protein [Sorangium cellulosum]|uniref:MPN domain-containing protein n=1 Tax=Sorangium cellulosum So0157-2 TaxID=1254432 RepID=S4Y7C0_SORCE|nr:JAB domain-containing protein [Sorangium cellulosum]AGP40764.1 hypothetical protein SCE1572_43525 [Sorangium cellulosum So0157-2]